MRECAPSPEQRRTAPFLRKSAILLASLASFNALSDQNLMQEHRMVPDVISAPETSDNPLDTVVTANLFHSNGDIQSVLDQDPDIAFLQETQLDSLQAAVDAGYYVAFMPTRANMSSGAPEEEGNAILSRYLLVNTDVKELDDNTGALGERRNILTAIVYLGAPTGLMSLRDVHLSTDGNVAALQLSTAIDEIGDAPAIIAGDMNHTPNDSRIQMSAVHTLATLPRFDSNIDHILPFNVFDEGQHLTFSTFAVPGSDHSGVRLDIDRPLARI